MLLRLPLLIRLVLHLLVGLRLRRNHQWALARRLPADGEDASLDDTFEFEEEEEDDGDNNSDQEEDSDDMSDDDDDDDDL